MEGGAVTVWVASLWLHPLAPLGPPTSIFLPSPESVKVIQTNMVKSAIRLPGAMFQEWEGLIQAHSATPSQTGSRGRARTCSILLSPT